VADDENIDEGGEDFGVLRAWPSTDHQRILQGPILAEERNAAQVEHCQQVRVTDFVLEAETDEIEILKRREGLKTVERHAVVPQQGLEVEPRSEGSLAGPLRVVV